MLYKRGKTYWVKFKVHGQEVRQSCRTDNRKEALVEAARLKVEASKAIPARPKSGCQLSQLAAADIQRALAEGADPATRIKTLEWMWTPLLKYFGVEYNVAKIDYDAVMGYVGHRRRQGVRGQTIRREVQALKRGMEIAKRRRWLHSLPDEWPTLKSDPPKLAQKGKLHPPELMRCLMSTLGPHMRDQAWFDIYTGLRAAELKRVQFGWVERGPYGSKILRVPATASKTRKERIIALPPEAVEIIERRRETAKSELVFPHGNLAKNMRAACQRIWYDKVVTMRDLRHFFATTAEHVSQDRKAAQDMLGHSHEAMTNRYLHSTVDRIVAAGVAASEAVNLALRGTAEGAQSQDDNAENLPIDGLKPLK